MKRRKILSDLFYTFSITTTTKIIAYTCIWRVDVSNIFKTYNIHKKRD